MGVAILEPAVGVAVEVGVAILEPQWVWLFTNLGEHNLGSPLLQDLRSASQKILPVIVASF